MVIGSSKAKETKLETVHLRSWATIIDAISASGHYFEPGIIFKCKTLQKQYFSDELGEEFKELFFTESENDWTSNEIAFWWLREVLIPQLDELRDGDHSRPALLVMDGHGSHCTVSLIFKFTNSSRVKLINHIGFLHGGVFQGQYLDRLFPSSHLPRHATSR